MPRAKNGFWKVGSGRPGIGFIAAVVAVMLSSAGSATAAALITGKEVKDESLTGLDVKDHTIKRADLAADAVGAQGPKGDTGAQGPKGATGAQGPRGEAGSIGTITWRETTGNTGGYGIAQCHAGEQVVSGGYTSDSPVQGVTWNHFMEGGEQPDGWIVRREPTNSPNPPVAITIYVACASTS
jgi:hypothetical protein